MTRRQASTRTVDATVAEQLVDGVPDWMMASAYDWIEQWTTEEVATDRLGREVRLPEGGRIFAIERYLQIKFGLNDARQAHEFLMRYVRADDTHCLDVIEAILATNNNVSFVVDSINRILVSSGSKWVAKKQEDNLAAYLEERVDATSAAAYEETVNDATNASGGYLKSAWSVAFNRNPNASQAYSNAIKAVEAAAWPIITPSNNTATLGHIIGEIRANPSRWSTAITERTTDVGMTTLLNALILMWEGQTDRHGTANPVTPTQEAAEQAVFTAIMVCSYFNRGYVS